MKTLIALIALVCASAPAPAETLTKEERERALGELRRSYFSSLWRDCKMRDGTSSRRLRWLAEIAEHIAPSEDTIFGLSGS
jgi:hypothetical protein